MKKIEKVNNWLFFGQFRLFRESQLYDINVIAHIGSPYKVKWRSKLIFVRIVKTVFEINCNSSQLAFHWSFLAMFLKSQPFDVNVIAHIVPPHSVKRLYKFSFESYGVFERTSICFEMTVENFVRIPSNVFEKIEIVHNWLIFGQFRLFLESQPYDIDVIAHIGPPNKVKRLLKYAFESLRQFLKKIVTAHNWRFFGRFWLCFSNPSQSMLMSLHT